MKMGFLSTGFYSVLVNLGKCVMVFPRGSANKRFLRFARYCKLFFRHHDTFSIALN